MPREENQDDVRVRITEEQDAFLRSVAPEYLTSVTARVKWAIEEFRKSQPAGKRKKLAKAS